MKKICAALLAGIVLTLGVSFPAAAAESAGCAALERYAAELSSFTGEYFYINDNTRRYIDYMFEHPDYTWDAVISYVNIGLDRYFYSDPFETADPRSPDVLVNKYRRLPEGFVPANLETISAAYSIGAQRLARPARLAFEKMCAAAKQRGHIIFATSAYRSYDRQARVYDEFIAAGHTDASAIHPDLLAARPGHSEHQTGLAVDVIRANGALVHTAVYKWYAANAHKYGFIVRYPSGKEHVTGFTGEPWHLRYLGVELATAVYNSGYTYDEYYSRHFEIPPKSGAETAVGVTVTTDITTDSGVHRLTAYRVLGGTYYKLRDIAAILDGTDASFDIGWDDATRRVSLIKGAAYSSDKALNPSEPGQARLVTAAAPRLLAGPQAYEPAGYMVDGSNYLLLGDMAQILGFAVSSDWAGGLRLHTADAPENALEILKRASAISFFRFGPYALLPAFL